MPSMALKASAQQDPQGKQQDQPIDRMRQVVSIQAGSQRTEMNMALSVTAFALTPMRTCATNGRNKF